MSDLDKGGETENQDETMSDLDKGGETENQDETMSNNELKVDKTNNNEIVVGVGENKSQPTITDADAQKELDTDIGVENKSQTPPIEDAAGTVIADADIVTIDDTFVKEDGKKYYIVIGKKVFEYDADKRENTNIEVTDQLADDLIATVAKKQEGGRRHSRRNGRRHSRRHSKKRQQKRQSKKQNGGKKRNSKRNQKK